MNTTIATTPALTLTPASAMELFATASYGNKIGYELVVDLDGGHPRISETNSSDNSITFYRHHGHEVALTLPATVDANGLAEWYNTTARPLVAEIIAGYTSEWNGSNHIGKLSDEAAFARRKLASLLTDEWSEAEGSFDYDDDLFAMREWWNGQPSCPIIRHENAGSWDACDWFQTVDADDLKITAETTDDEIRTLAGEAIAEASSQYVLLDTDDVVSYFTGLRDRLLDEE